MRKESRYKIVPQHTSFHDILGCASDLAIFKASAVDSCHSAKVRASLDLNKSVSRNALSYRVPLVVRVIIDSIEVWLGPGRACLIK